MNQTVAKTIPVKQSLAEHGMGIPSEHLSPSAPPISDTCVGGVRISDSDCVECLGSVFHCEHMTVIESRWYCHHPRALEIAARTEARKTNHKKNAQRRVPTDVGKRLGKT